MFENTRVIHKFEIGDLCGIDDFPILKDKLGVEITAGIQEENSLALKLLRELEVS